MVQELLQQTKKRMKSQITTLVFKFTNVYRCNFSQGRITYIQQIADLNDFFKYSSVKRRPKLKKMNKIISQFHSKISNRIPLPPQQFSPTTEEVIFSHYLITVTRM